jgi:hypothetical protein
MSSRIAAFGALCVLVVMLPDAAFAQRGGRLREVAGAVGNVPVAERQQLEPSDISFRLRDLDDPNPFAGAEPVDYLVTGMRSYDNFFEEVAKIEGTMVLAQNALSAVQQLVQGDIIDRIGPELLGDMGGAANLTEAQRNALAVALLTGDARSARRQFPSIRQDALWGELPSLEALEDTYDPIVDALTDLPERAMEFVDSGQEFVNSATSDFAGTNAVLIPQISRELAASVQTLRDVGASSVELARQLATFVP